MDGLSYEEQQEKYKAIFTIWPYAHVIAAGEIALWMLTTPSPDSTTLVRINTLELVQLCNSVIPFPELQSFLPEDNHMIVSSDMQLTPSAPADLVEAVKRALEQGVPVKYVLVECPRP